MSKNLAAFFQTHEGSKCPSSTPVTAIAPVANGDAALVPPAACQPGVDLPGSVQYMATLSATADMSATLRILQPVSVCQRGFGIAVLHVLPDPFQAVSVQPR